MNQLRFCAATALAILAGSLAFVLPSAGRADSESSALFSSDEAVEVEIQAPWRKLTRKKDDTRWPATLLMTDSSGEARPISLTVERRGISRQRVCKFPPIRLRFDKESVKGTPFKGEGALKLVTHCDKGDRWTQYYVREMLAYRIYNLISEYSFRVRPLRVRYRDSDRNKEPDEHFAFLIEDIDKVADRFELKELDIQSTLPGNLDPETASRMALFQFMIGNLDWSPLKGPDSCCHNSKLIGNESAEPPLIPVPYDFDASGIVDAHYAVPPDQLGVRSVTTRLFRGFCRHNDSLPAARAHIQALQPEIMALVEKEVRLNDRSRKKTLEYLEEFFEILADDERFEEDVVSVCRG